MTPRTWSRAFFAVVLVALCVLGACTKASDLTALRAANQVYSDALTAEASALSRKILESANQRAAACGASAEMADCRRRAHDAALLAAEATAKDVDRRISVQHAIADALDLAADCESKGDQACAGDAIARARELLPVTK